ncbi:hypothetical protein ACLB2K_061640 [Fragaria x ananassa]
MASKLSLLLVLSFLLNAGFLYWVLYVVSFGAVLIQLVKNQGVAAAVVMEILAGAAAGQAFALLYQGVNFYVTESLEFEPHLKQVRETLNSLKQLATQRGAVGLLAEERAEFKTVWEEGTCLVEKLSKVHNMSMLKPIYNGQLDNLDKLLNRQLMRIVQ